MFRIDDQSGEFHSDCAIMYLRSLAASTNRVERSILIVLAASHCRCMINTICCTHSKIPPDDEYLICWKQVEDDY